MNPKNTILAVISFTVCIASATHALPVISISNGEGCGTGVAISKNEILTAGHVAARFCKRASCSGMQLTGTKLPSETAASPQTGSAWFDPVFDIAVITTVADLGPEAVTMTSEDVIVGEKVSLPQYGGCKVQSVVTGKVTEINAVTFVSSTPILAGGSGGPVVDASNSLVGVVFEAASITDQLFASILNSSVTPRAMRGSVVSQLLANRNDCNLRAKFLNQSFDQLPSGAARVFDSQRLIEATSRMALCSTDPSTAAAFSLLSSPADIAAEQLQRYPIDGELKKLILRTSLEKSGIMSRFGLVVQPAPLEALTKEFSDSKFNKQFYGLVSRMYLGADAYLLMLIIGCSVLAVFTALLMGFSLGWIQRDTHGRPRRWLTLLWVTFLWPFSILFYWIAKKRRQNKGKS